MMPTMTIEPALYQRMMQTANTQDVTLEDVLQEALQHYFWDLDRQKIRDEAKQYRQNHAQLKETFLGQFVALHEGQVVDHDTEFMPLYQRVRGKFAPVAVMITQVRETADEIISRRGFRLETPHS